MLVRAGRGIVLGFFAAGFLLLGASPAIAKTCPSHGHAPPGNSEAGQYTETVPGPCGDQNVGGGGGNGHQNAGGGGGGPSSGGSGGGPSLVGALPAASVHRLQQLGHAGAVTERFANRTAVPASGGKGKAGQGAGGRGGSAQHGAGGGPGGGGSSDLASADGIGSVVGALASLVTGGSGQGVGMLLPVLLGMVFLGGMAFVALRSGRTQ